MDFKNFYVLTSSLHNIRRIKCEPLCKKTGLNATSLNVLQYLSICGDFNTAKDLTKMYGMKNAAFSIIIDRLEKEGLVEQKVDAEDRRIKHILLTKKAEAIAEQLRALTKSTEVALSVDFSEEEKNVLEKSILKLTNNILNLEAALVNDKKSERQSAMESFYAMEKRNEMPYGGGYKNRTGGAYSTESNL